VVVFFQWLAAAPGGWERGEMRSVQPRTLGSKSGRFLRRFGGNGTKKFYFEKQTREVIENKGSGPKNKPKQTQKRSREVVENTRGQKKRTRTNPKTNPAILLKIKEH
jgi:hypothetical protein